MYRSKSLISDNEKILKHHYRRRQDLYITPHIHEHSSESMYILRLIDQWLEAYELFPIMSTFSSYVLLSVHIPAIILSSALTAVHYTPTS